MRFHVEKMSCESCARHVAQTIIALDPDAEVAVDVAGKQVTVDTLISAQAIEAALAADGYPARVI